MQHGISKLGEMYAINGVLLGKIPVVIEEQIMMVDKYQPSFLADRFEPFIQDDNINKRLPRPLGRFPIAVTDRKDTLDTHLSSGAYVLNGIEDLDICITGTLNRTALSSVNAPEVIYQEHDYNHIGAIGQPIRDKVFFINNPISSNSLVVDGDTLDLREGWHSIGDGIAYKHDGFLGDHLLGYGGSYRNGFGIAFTTGTTPKNQERKQRIKYLHRDITAQNRKNCKHY